MKANILVRDALTVYHLHQYQLSDFLAVNNKLLNRWLHEEMDENEQALLIKIIQNKDNPVRRAELIQEWVKRFRTPKKHRRQTDYDSD